MAGVRTEQKAGYSVRARWLTEISGADNGLFGAVYGVASITAPLMGGALTEHVSWRWW